MADSVARSRRDGVGVSDTDISDTHLTRTRIASPNMGRIELAEHSPEAPHYKANQNWK